MTPPRYWVRVRWWSEDSTPESVTVDPSDCFTEALVFVLSADDAEAAARIVSAHVPADVEVMDERAVLAVYRNGEKLKSA
jgi:hypothetical protein